MSCTDKNPLSREGISQLKRVLAALDVHYADVDERESADLILFAKRYARYLNYFNDQNNIDSDWQPLMMMDESVTLATLSKIDAKRISDYKKLLYKNIALSTTDADAKKYFKYLFDTLFSLAKIIDDQFKLLPDDEYKTIIKDVIQRKLQLPLSNIEKCFNDFKAALPDSLFNYAAVQLDSDAPIEIISDENFQVSNLSPEWKTTAALVITLPVLPDAKSKIIYIISHNLFNSAIDALLNGVAMIVSRAKDLFEKTLADFPTHAPHYALFLTFTKLFKIAQDELNLYTKRHLDFYYKDVLSLINKEPIPDTAHLTFELQKNTEQELLKKDILFKGGKDITGKEISYRLTDDVVINKAIVSKIHSQHFDDKGKLIAYPVANSEDGKGGKLLSADKSWFTFGNPKRPVETKIGFAIASNILFLNEGERTISVTVNFDSDISGFNNNSKYNLKCFEAKLTGKKDWYPVNKENITASISGPSLTFSFTLDANAPAIIPYTEKVHKENLAINLPFLKFYLDQNTEKGIPYQEFCSLQIRNVDITVNVQGVKDLMLSNDKGTIDSSKPFKPFGDFPEKHAGFYIGSKEIFQKNLNTLIFNFDWKPIQLFSLSKASKKPSSGKYAPKYFADNFHPETANYLTDENWNTSFSFTGNKIEFGAGNLFTKSGMSFDSNEALKSNSFEGFLKLSYDTDDYSLQSHLKEISNAINLTKFSGTTINTKPTPVPKEVILNDFSLDYIATEEIDFKSKRNDLEANNNLFFQLAPFGYAEVFNDGITLKAGKEGTEKFTLLADINNNGELFIGFENAIEDSVVTVLFEVAEGSSDPLKENARVNWYYLSDNAWIKYDDKRVADGTKNFSQSGIVSLPFPSAITNQNTLLETGLHWIKATVVENIDAVCKMILIQAQAGSVELVQDETRQIEFRKIIPAGTISKLVEGKAAVKTITQPFDGFNGRVRESDEHFYLRVSERLRHKQRAITIWDYEHLILEQFPQLYKVKCLNHSGFYTNGDDKIFCENFPGHVTIVPIPDLKNNTNVNWLKPYPSIGLLNNIKDYLKKINCPFVRIVNEDDKTFEKLHVTTPQFEEIQLSFNVVFNNDNKIFYTDLLNREIEKFLCSWAFDSPAEINFGTSINKSLLINFIEERPYVDYLTEFKMFQFIPNEKGDMINQGDREEAVASTSRSILVSFYREETNQRHLITPIDSPNC